jgi:hypothetical protein
MKCPPSASTVECLFLDAVYRSLPTHRRALTKVAKSIDNRESAAYL